jgi:hypothetical protein
MITVSVRKLNRPRVKSEALVEPEGAFVAGDYFDDDRSRRLRAEPFERTTHHFVSNTLAAVFGGDVE